MKIIWISPELVSPNYSLSRSLKSCDLLTGKYKCRAVFSGTSGCLPVDHSKFFALWAFYLSHIPIFTSHMRDYTSKSEHQGFLHSFSFTLQLITHKRSCCCRVLTAFPGWAVDSAGQKLCVLLCRPQFLAGDFSTISFISVMFCPCCIVCIYLHTMLPFTKAYTNAFWTFPERIPCTKTSILYSL